MIQIDMKMPKSCRECPFSYIRPYRRGIECKALKRNNRISRVIYYLDEKPERCPLKEVGDK